MSRALSRSLSNTRTHTHSHASVKHITESAHTKYNYKTSRHVIGFWGNKNILHSIIPIRH